MIFGFEMFGAFLFGVVFAAVTIAVVGRRIVRKKLAGFIDLTALSYSTAPPKIKS